MKTAPSSLLKSTFWVSLIKKSDQEAKESLIHPELQYWMNDFDHRILIHQHMMKHCEDTSPHVVIKNSYYYGDINDSIKDIRAALTNELEPKENEKLPSAFPLFSSRLFSVFNPDHDWKSSLTFEKLNPKQREKFSALLDVSFDPSDQPMFAILAHIIKSRSDISEGSLASFFLSDEEHRSMLAFALREGWVGLFQWWRNPRFSTDEEALRELQKYGLLHETLTHAWKNRAFLTHLWVKEWDSTTWKNWLQSAPDDAIPIKKDDYDDNILRIRTAFPEWEEELVRRSAWIFRIKEILDPRKAGQSRVWITQIAAHGTDENHLSSIDEHILEAHVQELISKSRPRLVFNVSGGKSDKSIHLLHKESYQYVTSEEMRALFPAWLKMESPTFEKGMTVFRHHPTFEPALRDWIKQTDGVIKASLPYFLKNDHFMSKFSVFEKADAANTFGTDQNIATGISKMGFQSSSKSHLYHITTNISSYDLNLLGNFWTFLLKNRWFGAWNAYLPKEVSKDEGVSRWKPTLLWLHQMRTPQLAPLLASEWSQWTNGNPVFQEAKNRDYADLISGSWDVWKKTADFLFDPSRHDIVCQAIAKEPDVEAVFKAFSMQAMLVIMADNPQALHAREGELRQAFSLLMKLALRDDLNSSAIIRDDTTTYRLPFLYSGSMSTSWNRTRGPSAHMEMLEGFDPDAIVSTHHGLNAYLLLLILHFTAPTCKRANDSIMVIVKNIQRQGFERFFNYCFSDVESFESQKQVLNKLSKRLTSLGKNDSTVEFKSKIKQHLEEVKLISLARSHQRKKSEKAGLQEVGSVPVLAAPITTSSPRRRT